MMLPMSCVVESIVTILFARLPVALNVAVSALFLTAVEPGAAPPTQSRMVDQLPLAPLPFHVWLAAKSAGAIAARSPPSPRSRRAAVSSHPVT